MKGSHDKSHSPNPPAQTNMKARSKPVSGLRIGPNNRDGRWVCVWWCGVCPWWGSVSDVVVRVTTHKGPAPPANTHGKMADSIPF